MPQFTQRYRAGDIRPMDPVGAYRQGREQRQRYDFNQTQNRRMSALADQEDLNLKGMQHRQAGVEARRLVKSPGELDQWREQYQDLAQEEDKKSRATRIAGLEEESKRLRNAADRISKTREIYKGAKTQGDFDVINARLDPNSGVTPLASYDDLKAFTNEAPEVSDLMVAAADAAQAAAKDPDNERLQYAAQWAKEDAQNAVKQRQREQIKADLDIEEQKSRISKNKAASGSRGKPPASPTSNEFASTTDMLRNDPRFSGLDEAGMKDVASRISADAKALQAKAAATNQSMSFTFAIDLLMEEYSNKIQKGAGGDKSGLMTGNYDKFSPGADSVDTESKPGVTDWSEL